MAPKRRARAAVGSVVRTRRTLVEETVEVSVVEPRAAAGPTEEEEEKKKKVVVEVEIQEREAEQPPAQSGSTVVMKGEGEVAAPQQPPAAESEEETQPPSEAVGSIPDEGQQKPAGEERRGVLESQVENGFKGQAVTEPAGAEAENAEVGKMDEGNRRRVQNKEEEKKKKNRGIRRRRRRKAGIDARGGAMRGGGRGYKRYVFRVLKQVHPELRVSSMAMTVLDSLMKDMFERLVEEATRLSKYSGKVTLTSREIQGAVRLVLPGELGKHAVAEGSKAVATYMASDKAGADS